MFIFVPDFRWGSAKEGAAKTRGRFSDLYWDYSMASVT